MERLRRSLENIRWTEENRPGGSQGEARSRPEAFRKASRGLSAKKRFVIQVAPA
jgi:hypothetical protein